MVSCVVWRWFAVPLACSLSSDVLSLGYFLLSCWMPCFLGPSLSWCTDLLVLSSFLSGFVSGLFVAISFSLFLPFGFFTCCRTAGFSDVRHQLALHREAFPFNSPHSSTCKISVLVTFVLSVLFCSLTFAEYRTKPCFTVRLTSSISYLLIALNPMNCSEFYCLVLLHNVPCIISQHR